MALEPQAAAPSTLIDVLVRVKGLFDAVGDATLVQIGARYIDQFGVGHGPKVLFVPEPPNGGGAMTKAARLGNPARQVHACDVYVRANEETGDDAERFVQLYALSDRVVGFVAEAGAGRIGSWGACSDASPLKVSSGVGCGLAYSFMFERDIEHDAKAWRGPLRDVNGNIIETQLTTPPDTSAPRLPTSPAAVDGNLDLSLNVTIKE